MLMMHPSPSRANPPPPSSPQFHPALRPDSPPPPLWPHSWPAASCLDVEENADDLQAGGLCRSRDSVLESLRVSGPEAFGSKASVLNLLALDNARRIAVLETHHRKRRFPSMDSPACLYTGNSELGQTCLPADVMHPYRLEIAHCARGPRLPSQSAMDVLDELRNRSGQGITRKRVKKNSCQPNDERIDRRERSQKESHIHSERLRRRSMNRLFETVRSMLPIPISTKTDKCTLISEIMKHINLLQHKVEQLQQKRTKLLAASKYRESKAGSQNESSKMTSVRNVSIDCGQGLVLSGAVKSSVSLSCDQVSTQPTSSPRVQLICSEKDVLISMSSFNKPNLLSGVMCVLQGYRLDVISANMSTSDSIVFHSIHAKMTGTSELAKDDLQSALLDSIVPCLDLSV